MSLFDPRRAGPRLKLAHRLRGLAERDDLPLPAVDTYTLGDGSELVRAR
jgi:hypothetical protein